MVAFNFLTGGISTLLVAFFLLACGFFNAVAAEDVLAFKSVYFFLSFSYTTLANRTCLYNVETRSFCSDIYP